MFQRYFTCAWGKIIFFSSIQYSYVSGVLCLFVWYSNNFFLIKSQSHLYFRMPFIVISSNFPSPSDVTVQKKQKKTLSYPEHLSSHCIFEDLIFGYASYTMSIENWSYKYIACTITFHSLF